MKHVFKYLNFAEDREHAGSVATKELKLDRVEKFVIHGLANDIKGRGCTGLVRPGRFDELVQIYEAGGDGIELLNYRVKSRKVATAALFHVIHEPDFQCLEMVHEIIRIARDLEAPADAPLDC